MAMFAIPIVVDDHFAPETDECEVVGDNFVAESSDDEADAEAPRVAPLAAAFRLRERFLLSAGARPVAYDVPDHTGAVAFRCSAVARGLSARMTLADPRTGERLALLVRTRNPQSPCVSTLLSGGEPGGLPTWRAYTYAPTERGHQAPAPASDGDDDGLPVYLLATIRARMGFPHVDEVAYDLAFGGGVAASWAAVPDRSVEDLLTPRRGQTSNVHVVELSTGARVGKVGREAAAACAAAACLKTARAGHMVVSSAARSQVEVLGMLCFAVVCDEMRAHEES